MGRRSGGGGGGRRPMFGGGAPSKPASTLPAGKILVFINYMEGSSLFLAHVDKN